MSSLIELAKQTLEQTAQFKPYSVVLSNITHDSKPQAFAKLNQELDYKHSQTMQLVDLLDALNTGRTFRNGRHEIPLKQKEKDFFKTVQQEHGYTAHQMNDIVIKWAKVTNEKAKQQNKPQLYKNTLVQANLAVLDVDDMIGKANPLDVMKSTGAIALYYSFSHNELSELNTPMYRYRLLYDLSESANNSDELSYIQEQLKTELLKQYPYLHDQTIANKSHGIDNLTRAFFGTNKGYVINDNYKTVDVTEYKEKLKLDNELNQVSQKFTQLQARSNQTDAKEILEIAEHLGDTNEIITHDEWTTLAIGLWNTAQTLNIDDEIIIKALQTLDGERNSDKYYLDFKKPLRDTSNRATIGTLLKLAISKGYKRTYRQLHSKDTPKAHQTATTTHEIEKYVDKSTILEILDSDEQKSLIVADTGTGKTYATIKASQEYLKNNHDVFIYFASPTKDLSEQIVNKHNLDVAILGNMDVRKAVINSIYADKRLLIGTYDKTKYIHEFTKGYKLIIIIDEIHKTVTDYSYRHKAIKGMLQAESHKTIGLTATPSDLDKSEYKDVHNFKLKRPKMLADSLEFIEYNNANEYEQITVKTILRDVKDGNKSLVFIDNKNMIDKVARTLRKKGLKVATITADNRKSRTYKHILEQESFNKNVDVVLTTRVLADGINIQNDSKDYTCIIAPSYAKNVNFYNLNIIKQASNRLRKQYKRISIPFYVKSDIASDTAHPRASVLAFNIDNEYNRLLMVANVLQAKLRHDFKDNFNQLRPRTVENYHGIFTVEKAQAFNFELAYKNRRLAQQNLKHDSELLEQLEQLESDMLDIDTRAIRYRASEQKEWYYKLNPYAFRREITANLDVISVIDIHESKAFTNADSDIKKLLDEIDELNAKTEQEKRNNLRKILKEPLFYKLQHDYFITGQVNQSTHEWKTLKKEMNRHQYTGLVNVIQYLEHDQAIKELEYIDAPKKTNELARNCKAIDDIQAYQSTEPQTATHQVFNVLADEIAYKTYLLASLIDDDIEQLAKDFKLTGRYTIAKRQKLFKDTFNKYFIKVTGKNYKKNNKTIRPRTVKIIELNDIAERREISLKEVKEMHKNYKYKNA